MGYREKLATIQGDFQDLDAFDRLNELIVWSTKLPEGTPELLRRENLIEGCQSKVWMTVAVKNGLAEIHAYSDTRIIRGVLAILCEVFNGQPVDDISPKGGDLLEQLKLGYLFSETRKNGIRSICERIWDLFAKAK